MLPRHERGPVQVIPTLELPDSLTRIAGSSRQMKQALDEVLEWTASRPLMTLATGQLTWEGRAAGSRAVQHDADVVLYLVLEGPRRILRVHKSRISESPRSYVVPDFSRGGA